MKADIVFVLAPRAIASAKTTVELLARSGIARTVELLTLVEDKDHQPAPYEACAKTTELGGVVAYVLERSRPHRASGAPARVGILCLHDRILGFAAEVARTLNDMHSRDIEIVLTPPDGVMSLRDKEWLEGWRARCPTPRCVKHPSQSFDLNGENAIEQLHAAISRMGEKKRRLVAKPALGTQSVAVIQFDGERADPEIIVRRLRNSLSADAERYGMPVSLPFRDGSPQRIVIQPLVEGTEISVDGFIHAGRASCVVHRKLGAGGGGQFAKDEFLIAPWQEFGDRPDSKALTGMIEHLFGSAKVFSWPFHAEAIVSDEGVFLLEVNARPAGGLITDSVKRLTGHDVFQTLVDIVSERTPQRLEAMPGRHTCEVTLYPEGSGVVSRIRGIDDLPLLQGYVTHRIFSHPGQRVEVADREEYGVIAVVEGPTEEATLRSAQAVKDLIRIEIS